MADESKFFYEALGRKQGRIGEIIGPSTWGAGLRALFKGNLIGIPAGDTLMMPGFFVVDKKGKILWEYPSQHVGDHPDFTQIPKYIRKS